MFARWLIAAFFCSTAFAQSVVGAVERVSGNMIQVKTGAQPVALYTDAHTEIWKGQVFHDLKPVAVGDSIMARYRADASGKLVADAVWLNITNFWGVITRVADNEFNVLTNPNADPESAYKKENKAVEVDANTTFEASAEGDLKPGRNVQVVGLVLKNGEIEATRVIVYEGNRPVRMNPDAIITLPNGTRR